MQLPGIALTVAIQVGRVFALFLFMKRMSEVTNINAVTAEYVGVEETGPAGAVAHRPGSWCMTSTVRSSSGPAEKFKETTGRSRNRWTK